MSLVMALSNSNGIVVSADKRLTCECVDSNIGEISFEYYDNTQKIFKTNHNHIIAFTGESMLSSKQFVSDALLDICDKIPKDITSLTNELIFVKEKLIPFAGFEDTTLTIAGIEDNKNILLTTLLKSSKISQTNNQIFAIGNTIVVQKLHESFSPKIESLSINESIEYLQFLNSSVNSILHFCKEPETVGKYCDIGIITPTTTELHLYEEPIEKENDNALPRNHLLPNIQYLLRHLRVR